MPKAIPSGLTREYIGAAISDLRNNQAHAFGESTKYELVYEGERYAPKAVVGLALGRLLDQPVGPDDFSGGQAPGQANYVLRELGFTVERKIASEAQARLVREESERRERMWAELLAAGGPRGLSPGVLRKAGVYGGAQGIWVDKAHTGVLDRDGATVGVLHTGRSYADDLDDDGVIYHYPNTRRPAARDAAEVNATKTAGELGLPLFVVTYPSPGSTRRDVYRGWVESWDDELGVFLIVFGDTAPDLHFVDNESEPFSLTKPRLRSRREVSTRSGQQRFQFAVFRRYGQACAVCGVSVPEMLDAAHIRPISEDGSDDPRNGMVLCASHHRAFDAGLFCVEPDSLRLVYSDGGPGREDLGIKRESLGHLRRRPHQVALDWSFQIWQKKHGVLQL